MVEVDSVNKQRHYLDAYKYSYNVVFFEEFKAEFIPDSQTLVQNDSARIDNICFRVNHSVKKVRLKWELFAKNIQDKGLIEFQIIPQFEEEEGVNYVYEKIHFVKYYSNFIMKVK